MDPSSASNASHPRPSRKLPAWIKVKAPQSPEYQEIFNILKKSNLHTVCQEAACPNIAECWGKKHATFMILGDICTRACAFCNVKTGKPGIGVDKEEPLRIALTVENLALSHVVITSVDRDDLPDGGAAHFAATIHAIRKHAPTTTIEVLTPDFLHKQGAVDIVASASPDVYNHNVETIPRLYTKVRPGARYFNSLNLLRRVKEIFPMAFTKSGLMVGLGESAEELYQVMDDLRMAGVDFLTLGQYLQPTPKHYPVAEYITPETFASYAKRAYAKGFLMVAASPLTRSSYHAGEDFAILKKKREATMVISR